MIKKFTENNFKWEKDPDYDYIIHEGSNSSICLRKISWNDREYKIDIRKYNYKDNKEIMSKGISLPDDAVDNMTEVLASTGYGDTRAIFKGIMTRDDFADVMESYKNGTIKEDDNGTVSDEEEEDEYYDPAELLS